MLFRKIPSVIKETAVPLPPPAPEENCKGFESDGYWELIHSLSAEEREKILLELKHPKVIKRAEKLEQELAENIMICSQLDNTRETFLAALLCLQKKNIQKSQLASLHLLDSAIRTLYTNPLCYFIHHYVDENQKTRLTYNIFHPENHNGLPTSIRRYYFNLTIVPDEKTKLEDLPRYMRHPLIRRFFQFTDDEWVHFSDEMKNMPVSETYVHCLIPPNIGCWSSIIQSIQKVLTCMQVLDWYTLSEDGPFLEKIMVIPTFSMFQAAINAKAVTLRRKPLKLVPTYYYLENEEYQRYKANGCIPLTMYLPESDPSLRYNSAVGKFRTNVDGHPFETAFAGAIHDVYHGFRELQMCEHVSDARLRLAFIAKNHPNNQLSPNHKPVSDILMDGELIYSYALADNTLFNDTSRPHQKEFFGSLFYTSSIKGHLADNLKRAFISDMVENQKDWQQCFEIGKEDLVNGDQEIYDEIKREFQSVSNLKI